MAGRAGGGTLLATNLSNIFETLKLAMSNFPSTMNLVSSKVSWYLFQ